MPLPDNADVVVVRHRWLDETTGAGVAGATITLEPVPAAGATTTPNLRDLTALAQIKTRSVTATFNPSTGYAAARVVATDDPDLEPYGGRKVTLTGETPYTIAVPYNAPLVTVDAEMAAAIPALTPGAQVRAIWLVEAAVIGGTPPAPVTSYLTAQQTMSAIVSGVAAHDQDPAAHSDIRALAGSGGGGGASQLTVTRTAAVALSGHRGVTPGASGLVYASNATLAHLAAPLWLTTAAASSGASVAAVTAGPVVEPSWTWTPGPVYLGANGQLTQTVPAAPGALFCAQIGYAVSATELHVDRTPSIRLS